MSELNEFILEIQQFFLAFLVLAFSFFLYKDSKTAQSHISLKTRFFLIPLFLIVSIGLMFNFYEGFGTQGLIYSIEFGLLITLCLMGPKYAVSFFIYLLLSRPWEVFDNQLMGSMPRDIFYLTAIVLIGYKFLRRQMYFRFNMGTIIILLFSSWVFLSAFFSPNQTSAIYNYGEVFLKGIIVFLLIQNGFNKGEDLKLAKITVVLAIIEKSIISFYQTYLQTSQSHGVVDEFQRLESVGILSNSNDIAAIFILAIPFCFFFVLKTKIRPFHWIVATIVLLLMSYLVWISQSRGAVLGLMASGASFYFLKVKSMKKIILISVLAMVAAIGAFSLMQRSASDVEGSTSNRIIFWKAGANMAIRNPVFGVGFWGFNDNFAGYAIDGNTGSEGTHMTAHSSWVQVMAENGFVALFLFLALWIYSLYRSYGIREKEPEYFISLVGYGVAITFLSHAYLLFPYILCSLAITQASLDESPKVAQSESLDKRIGAMYV